MPARRVLVIGGGAAGVAAAWACSGSDAHEVTLVERADVLGGVATTSEWNGVRFNDGVQGAAPSYANTLRLHRELGFTHREVKLAVSFGAGQYRWTNRQNWPILEEHGGDIRRFKGVLSFVNTFRAFFAGVSIKNVLKLFHFSDDFGDRIVYPLTALFFGTGNQTARTSSVLVSRVFFDPKFRLFAYDSDRFISTSPTMIAFDDLEGVYTAAQRSLESRGVAVRTGTSVESVVPSHDTVEVVYADGSAETYDHIIFACGAEVTLRLLGDRATHTERSVLSSVTYYNDVTVTHTDAEYMQNKFSTLDAMYMIRNSDDARPDLFEMGFHLSKYQNLREPLYQTIFLNKDEDESTWSMGDIDASKVVLTKGWRQFAHTAAHYREVVPRVKYLHRGQQLIHCGAWVLANTHEMATVTGFCAARKLGCPFPFKDDAGARETCRTLYNILY